jgi:hypothetical protein
MRGGLPPTPPWSGASSRLVPGGKAREGAAAWLGGPVPTRRSRRCGKRCRHWVPGLPGQVVPAGMRLLRRYRNFEAGRETSASECWSWLRKPGSFGGADVRKLAFDRILFSIPVILSLFGGDDLLRPAGPIHEPRLGSPTYLGSGGRLGWASPRCLGHTAEYQAAEPLDRHGRVGGCGGLLMHAPLTPRRVRR